MTSNTNINNNQKVYLGYSPEQLEVQYNNRAAVPEHAEIAGNWAQDSADIRQNAACQLDLSYGSRTREKIDLFQCGTPLSPLLIYVHGGYWQRMNKSDYSFVCKEFLNKDINVALVGYDLCPSVTLGEIVQQIRNACVWLWKNTGKLDFDQDSIFISGHSAGGHLSAMALATAWQKLDASLPPVVIQGGIAISGLYELQPLRYTSINDALSLDSDSANQYSPIFLSPPSSIRLLLSVGALESSELRRQSQSLSKNWQGKVSKLISLEVPSVNHFTILDCLVDPTHPLFQNAINLIKSQ